MKGSRFSEEQIIGVLREHEAGARTEKVCRCHGISSAGASARLRNRCGGISAVEGKASSLRHLHSCGRGESAETRLSL
jgi:putative transposase